jgi:hypothetical protein
MKVEFASFRRRILRALDAAGEIGLTESLLRSVLTVGARPPASNHVAGALAYLERAHMVSRAADLSVGTVWTLTEKGAWELKNAATPHRRRRGTPSAATAPPSF